MRACRRVALALPVGPIKMCQFAGFGVACGQQLAESVANWAVDLWFGALGLMLRVELSGEVREGARRDGLN